MGDTGHATQHQGGSARDRAYVLTLLTLAYMFSCADRSILGIVQESIKLEFRLSDFQLGLLGGPAFALLYAGLALPVARAADRGDRKTILAICVMLWSVMTAFCGLAGNYLQIFAARMGVSVGEAGCNPIANSIISDSFPPDRRATAISTYALGISLGGLMSALVGGWLASAWGWRAAFVTLGAAGLLLAAIFALTVREPARSAPASDVSGLWATAAFLFGKPSFRHATFAAALTAFTGYGVNQYLVSFLIRSHGLTVLQGAGLVGIIIGICGGVGAFASGYLADRLAPRVPNAIVLVPAVGVAMAGPLYFTAFFVDGLLPAMAAVIAGAVFHNLYSAGVFAVTQGLAKPRMRATAVAFALLVINLLGYGLGPPAVGWVSDLLASNVISAHGVSHASCSAAAAPVCALAAEEGLRRAMMITALLQLWAALHFFLASRTLRHDWVG